MGRAPSELSIVSTTSARPSGARPDVPAKMTSSIFPPRRDLAPCSPITQLRASTTLDLPEPFGPTTQVMPGSKLRVVTEAKDLNPRKVRLLRYNAPPLDGVSSGDDRAAERRPHCNRQRPRVWVRRGAGPPDCRVRRSDAGRRMLAFHGFLYRFFCRLARPVLAADGGEGPELVQQERD